MNLQAGDFRPPRRRGLLFHAAAILILAAVTSTAFISLTSLEPGPAFVVAVITGLATLSPIPVLGYRAYALGRARYVLSRNSLALQWGLRAEDIPLGDIEWMRMATDLARPLPLPRFPMPGALLGLRRHPDLGLVEYLASESGKVLLVATARKVFAISPEDPAALTQAFARATEMGTLLPTAARSVYPSFVIASAWEVASVRFLWMATLFVNVGLFVWTSILVQGVAQRSPLPDPAAGAVTAASTSQLVLIPVASLGLGVGGWLAGLYLFRWERERPLAFAVWTSGALTALLFLLAVRFFGPAAI